MPEDRPLKNYAILKAQLADVRKANEAFESLDTRFLEHASLPIRMLEAAFKDKVKQLEALMKRVTRTQAGIDHAFATKRASDPGERKILQRKVNEQKPFTEEGTKILGEMRQLRDASLLLITEALKAAPPEAPSTKRVKTLKPAKKKLAGTRPITKQAAIAPKRTRRGKKLRAHPLRSDLHLPRVGDPDHGFPESFGEVVCKRLRKRAQSGQR